VSEEQIAALRSENQHLKESLHEVKGDVKYIRSELEKVKLALVKYGAAILILSGGANAAISQLVGG